jgi:hypothetical protein
MAPRLESIARAPGAPRKSPVRWHSPASAAWITPPWSPAPSLPHGVAARGRPSAPVQPGANAATNVCAGSEKKAQKLLAPQRAPGAPPADLAYGALALAARESQARRGESLGLAADDTSLGRCALPRAGWWRTTQPPRLPFLG